MRLPWRLERILKENANTESPFGTLDGNLLAGRKSVLLALSGFQPSEFPFVPEEQFIPFIEIFLEDDADALCGQIGTGVITVIGLVISFQTDVTGAVYQPFCFKIPYKVSVCQRVVTIAEVTVDKQPVVQQLSGKDAFELHICPTLFTGAEVGTDVPVIIVNDA